MKLLHVTPHLGGGVGKAHAALSGALSKDAVEQTFLLLEAPRDRRYADLLEAAGARVMVAKNLDQVAQMAAEADIVQFEFWNHPRLFECLARCEFPAMRSIFWSHISGLNKPLIPPGLMEASMRFVFSTEASFDSVSVALLPESAKAKIAAVNSGFGFPRTGPRLSGVKPSIAYLGTVDFVKMHSGFFDAIDRLSGDDIDVSIWGDPMADVVDRALAMRHPGRIKFYGQTAEPAAALSAADIFFYPLQPDHYGTAENALIEAMSLGLVPVVLSNAAEMAIVRHGETGFVARSIDEAASLLQMLLSSPEIGARVSRNATAYVAENRTAEQSARDFMVLWLGMLSKQPQYCDFDHAIGGSPAEWFLATQGQTGKEPPGSKTAHLLSKGTLAHFESVFAEDTSLARLRQSRS